MSSAVQVIPLRAANERQLLRFVIIEHRSIGLENVLINLQDVLEVFLPQDEAFAIMQRLSLEEDPLETRLMPLVSGEHYFAKSVPAASLAKVLLRVSALVGAEAKAAQFINSDHYHTIMKASRDEQALCHRQRTAAALRQAVRDLYNVGDIELFAAEHRDLVPLMQALSHVDVRTFL